MITLANPVETRTRPSNLAIASLLIHLCALAVLIHGHASWVAPMRLPGTEHGTRISIEYLPGQASIQTAMQPAKAQPRKTTAAAALPQPSPLPATPAPVLSAKSLASDHSEPAAGNDALGSGNVKIALLNFFPTPKPDLSALPHGTRGDVILDIVIDPTGNISNIKMTSGLGHGIDEAVIATVQTWTFHPATKNGQPVASEQELHFHYEA